MEPHEHIELDAVGTVLERFEGSKASSIQCGFIALSIQTVKL